MSHNLKHENQIWVSTFEHEVNSLKHGGLLDFSVDLFSFSVEDKRYNVQ